jgi:hypothetical protein
MLPAGLSAGALTAPVRAVGLTLTIGYAVSCAYSVRARRLVSEHG